MTLRTSSSRKFSFLACFASLLVGAAFRLRAQVDSASLTGLITDPSQAAVRDATVSVANAANGVERSTTSDDAGYYHFPSLPIGAYTVTVTQAGFAKLSEAVTLDPSAKARSDFQLVIGTASTSVEVQSESPQLSRDDASIGTVIDNQTIVSTPLFQRNWDDLIRLARACSRAGTRNRAAQRIPGERLILMRTAFTRCRIISFLTASTTTRFRRMCRS